MPWVDGTNQIVVIQRLAKRCSAVHGLRRCKRQFHIYGQHPSARWTNGQRPVASDSSTLSVENRDKWAADAGTACDIVPNGSGGWRFAQGKCKGD